MYYKNLHIIGTSHISRESVKQIRNTANQFNPDIVAVELDTQRLFALTHNLKSDYSLRSIGRIGFKGYLFAVIGGYLQKKLGDIVGVKPGSDMHEAVKYAHEHKKVLALIDQDIQITLKKFSERLTFKERMRFVWDLLSSPFQKRIRIDLTKVPEEELIEKLLGMLKDRYPNMHYTLVAERNKIMAKRLVRIMRDTPDKKILCVVGAGHKKEIMNIIKDIFESKKYDLV